jgi:hypothetical protein
MQSNILQLRKITCKKLRLFYTEALGAKARIHVYKTGRIFVSHVKELGCSLQVQTNEF